LRKKNQQSSRETVSPDTRSWQPGHDNQGDSALIFIDVKFIQLVIAMIPHALLIDGRQASEHFFLMEKPGLDVTVMAGMEEEIQAEGTGTVNIDSIASTME